MKTQVPILYFFGGAHLNQYLNRISYLAVTLIEHFHEGIAALNHI